jgi:hypothetical protein
MSVSTLEILEHATGGGRSSDVDSDVPIPTPTAARQLTAESVRGTGDRSCAKVTALAKRFAEHTHARVA